LLASVVLLSVGCSRSQAEVQLAPLPTPVAPGSAFEPIVLPRDDAPHDVLTEWWYYTGNLDAHDGRRYGFELVVFQVIRGDYPVLYLAHFGLTDAARRSFHHDTRVAQGSQLGQNSGFDLTVGGWRMRGSDGQDELAAAQDGYGIALSLRSRKPPALHDEDGLVSFGPVGDSYYYSRTRMSVEGAVEDHGERVSVAGEAWFDHQWGNFLVLGGGWDWFALQLDDGADLMLNYLRDEQDRVVGVWGSYIDPAGVVHPLHEPDFEILPTGRWTSPTTGGVYPMGWQVRLRDPAYELEVQPLVENQELSTRGIGPSYWEGAVDTRGHRDGQPVRGRGYVELTGYVKR
jgi:predicted secreted hydrolase